MKRKLVSILLCVSMVGVLAAGCGDKESAESTEDTGKAEGTENTDSGEDQEEGLLDLGLDLESVTVATSPGYAPFEFKEDEELKGYDVDIWNEFEARTGIKVEWEFADFSGLLGLLQSGKADAVSAQMAPDAEREKTFAFTDPINYYGSTVVVSQDNEDIKSVEDLAGKKVGVGSGNSMQASVEAMYPDGDVTFEVYTSATLEAMFADLEYGRIDAVLAQDIQTSMAMKENADLKIQMLDPFEYAPATIAVDKNNTELLDALNEFIKILREDGTLKELSEKWVGIDISVEK